MLYSFMYAITFIMAELRRIEIVFAFEYKLHYCIPKVTPQYLRMFFILFETLHLNE